MALQAAEKLAAELFRKGTPSGVPPQVLNYGRGEAALKTTSCPQPSF
jgi:hypothetical protein